jgi:hypothetical protein
MGAILARLISVTLYGFIPIFWISLAWGAELYIPPLNGKSGQSIDIPIMIDLVENLAGVKLVMTYDPELLTFNKGAKTKQTDSLMHIVNDKKPGLLIVVMAGARGIKGKDFPLLTLTFAVKEGLKGNHATQIKITEVQLMSDKLKDIKCSTKVGPLIISPSPIKVGEK